MDFTQIESVLALATTALGATGKAVSTAEAIKQLLTKGTPDGGKASELLNNLAGELTAANLMNVQLSDTLKSLSQQLRRDDQFEKEKARYELFQTNEADIVYRLKSDAANGQPIHFICPVCLNRDKVISYISGSGDYKRCQADTNHLFQFSNTPYQTRMISDGGWV
jgi:hypothetical protein